MKKMTQTKKSEIFLSIFKKYLSITSRIFILLAIPSTLYTFSQYRQNSWHVEIPQKTEKKARVVVADSAPILTKQTIYELVQAERDKVKLSELKINSKLEKAAELKANDICENQYWDHISKTGVTPWHWIKKAGYNYDIAGENLGEGYNYGQQLVSAWMNSEEHRENILKPRFKETGVAIKNCLFRGKNNNVVVQMFASPYQSQGSGVTTTGNPNTPIHCPINEKCGGGTTPLLQWECENSTCCGMRDGSWVFYKDKALCTRDQKAGK